MTHGTHNSPPLKVLSPGSTVPLEIIYLCGQTRRPMRTRRGLLCQDGKGQCPPHLVKMVIADGSSQRHRLLGFIGSLVGAAVCFFVAFLTLPMLALKYSYLLQLLTP